MKALWSLLFVLSSAGLHQGCSQKNSNLRIGSIGQGIEGTFALKQVDGGENVKNFNQTLTSMAHLTGLDIDNELAAEFGKIRFQLPERSDLASYSKFSEIAHIRYGFFMCRRYRVKDEVKDLYNPEMTTEEKFIDHLIAAFAHAEEAPLKDNYKLVLREILADVSLVPANSSAKTRLRDLACGAILSAQTTL